MTLLMGSQAGADAIVNNGPVDNASNTGTINNNTNSNAINFQEPTRPNSYFGTGGAGVAGGASVVTGSPSAYSHTHMYHGPWNFTPPHILFDPSKTINDNSAFSQCRIINTDAPLRSDIKDYLLGVFDEREYVASGDGASRSVRGLINIIVCGLNTRVPPSCVQYIGSGYTFLENYATTEAALVGLARMASDKGASLVGNVNCTYSELIKSYSTGLGAGLGNSNTVGEDSLFGLSGTIGWSTNTVKRPAQPHCTGDFYLGTLSGCHNAHMPSQRAAFSLGPGSQPAPPPAPPMYRRYLPPAPAPGTYAPAPSQRSMARPQGAGAQQQSVRGLW